MKITGSDLSTLNSSYRHVFSSTDQHVEPYVNSLLRIFENYGLEKEQEDFALKDSLRGYLKNFSSDHYIGYNIICKKIIECVRKRLSDKKKVFINYYIKMILPVF